MAQAPDDLIRAVLADRAPALLPRYQGLAVDHNLLIKVVEAVVAYLLAKPAAEPPKNLDEGLQIDDS